MGKDNNWIEKIPFSKMLPQHVIPLGMGPDGRRYYITQDGNKKPEDELTDKEWNDLQKYQPTGKDSGRI